MRPRRSGAIVLLSSLDGLQAEHGMFSYCVSKGALLNLARAAALDLARDQVTVNCVCPSVTRTPLLEGRLATIPNGEEVLRSYAERHPLGRVLTPRDIASAIAFVASPLATGITGAALPVDAGIGATWDNFRDPPWVGQAWRQWSVVNRSEQRRDAAVDEMVGAGDEARILRQQEGRQPRHLDGLADAVERMLGAPEGELLLRRARAVHLRDRLGQRRLDGAGQIAVTRILSLP